jgi:DNA polymerase
MTEHEVAPPPEHPEKRKRGRPKVQAAQVPLYDIKGETKHERLVVVYDTWHDCKRCPLHEGRLRFGDKEIVFGEGNPDSHVLIVGEAPGDEEMSKHVPFIGPAGHTLDTLLAHTTDDPEIQKLAEWYATAPRNRENIRSFHDTMHEWRLNEFFITNVVACQPPENRPPTNVEVKTCWERLWNTIYTVDPLIILAFGNSALAAVARKQTVQITKMRGQLFDVEFDGKFGKLTYPVMPLLHPSFLNRVADWKVKNGNFQRTIGDLRTAMKMLDFLRQQNYGTPIPVR